MPAKLLRNVTLTAFIFRLSISFKDFTNYGNYVYGNLVVLFFTILISEFFEWLLAFMKSIDFIIEDLITAVGVIIPHVTEVVKL